jgi:hypothetical protein
MTDSTEFEDFVAARYGALLRTAYLLTQDRALAEDLVQAALAKCWLAWPRIDGSDPGVEVGGVDRELVHRVVGHELQQGVDLARLRGQPVQHRTP